MTKTEHLLSMLAEECAEVAHRVSKALRFGLQDVQPGQSFTNAQRINMEINDLAAIMELLLEEGVNVGHVSERFISAKKEKVEKYLEYSRQCGTLTV